MMKNTLDILACFINTLSHILIVLIHAVKPVLCTLAIRVRRFCFKNFFASKRNEAKRDPFRMRFARSREKKLFFFSLHFASFRFEFFASNQSEINTPYFRFISLPKSFRFASFRFWFFRFAFSQNEINVFFALFRFKAKRFKHFFRFFSLY